MKIHTRGVIASFLALSFMCTTNTTTPPARACAPDLAYSILVNGNHPDLPLRLYAAGNIGVVQPGWAKSYLVVAYRYLNFKPLSKNEQDSIINLWHFRIKGGSRFSSMGLIDDRDAYLALRSKAIGADPKKNSDLSYNMDSFCYEHEISDSSMLQARQTLAQLLQKYKPLSPQVREWVKAQDGLYGLPGQKGVKVVVPLELAGTADSTLQDYRNYQIAAANFYLNKYDAALSKFEQIAAKTKSPMKDIASYMVLRVKAADVRLTHNDENNAVANLLQNAVLHADKVSTRENILNLLRPINYLKETSVGAIKMLSSSIVKGTTQRFGGDVGDLTFLLDGNPLHPESTEPISEELVAASDLADWVITIQSSVFADLDYDHSPEAKAKEKVREQRYASHALQMWRKTKTLAWLVAAVTTNGLRSSATSDLRDAANSVGRTSPAYLTCRFYIADALIESGKKQEARAVLLPLLSTSKLPPSSRNLFAMQMAAASSTAVDYLKFAVQYPPETLQSNTDLVTPKFLKDESSNYYSTEVPAFDSEVADDISRNAPLSIWMSFAQSNSIPQQFKSIVLRSAWTRAQLLQRNDQALKISDAMAATNPVLRNSVARFKSAPEGLARQFAGACVVLKNFGMTPYLEGGLERHGERVDEFDWYNGNFWVPFPLVKEKKDSDQDSWSFYETVAFNGSAAMGERMKGYGANGLNSRLTPAEKKQADTERALILKNNPSRYYGQTVLSWARSHPSDADVPEMLYRVVKLPKWTAESTDGSAFSKKAYFALHNNYPGSKWTKKAVCYY
ncbi:hypothetical protein BH10CYA1_BH10CYA1_36750 [soil metagenome]